MSVLLIAPAAARSAIEVTRTGMRVGLRQIPRIQEPAPVAPRLMPLVIAPIILRGLRDVNPAVSCAIDNVKMAPRLPLVLLIDLPDCDTSEDPSDADLIRALKGRLGRLIDGGEVLVLVRRRRFDPVDRIWRGWERKRGKIEEFCRLIRGDATTSFGENPLLPLDIDAVVTLDVDSRLGSNTVRALASAVHGIAGIWAPFIRVARSPRAGLFEWLNTPLFHDHSAPTRSFNQGWLGHDVFQGKGLIRIDPFVERTYGRIVERTVLSHDHLESLLVGAVTVESAAVEEPFPSTRGRWARRQNRWIRGDFQLLPWILSTKLRGITRIHLVENLLIHLAPVSCLGSVLLAASVATAEQAPALIACALASLRPTVMLLPIELLAKLIGPERWRARRLSRFAAEIYGEIAPFVSAMIFCAADALNTLHAMLVTVRRLTLGTKLLDWDDDAQIGHAWLVVCCLAAGAWSAGKLLSWDSDSRLPAFLIALWVSGPLVVKAVDVVLAARLPRPRTGHGQSSENRQTA